MNRKNLDFYQTNAATSMLKQTLENDLPDVSPHTSPDWNIREMLCAPSSSKTLRLWGQKEMEFFTGGLEEGSSMALHGRSAGAVRGAALRSKVLCCLAGAGQALMGTSCGHVWGKAKGTHSWGTPGEGQTEEKSISGKSSHCGEWGNAATHSSSLSKCSASVKFQQLQRSPTSEKTTMHF